MPATRRKRKAAPKPRFQPTELSRQYGQNLRLARTGDRTPPRMTQAQAATGLAVTQSTIARWESGEVMPDVYRQISLAKFYGLPVRLLFPVQDQS